MSWTRPTRRGRYHQELSRFKGELLAHYLAVAHGNRSQCARLLGLHRTVVCRLLRAFLMTDRSAPGLANHAAGLMTTAPQEPLETPVPERRSLASEKSASEPERLYQDHRNRAPSQRERARLPRPRGQGRSGE